MKRILVSILAVIIVLFSATPVAASDYPQTGGFFNNSKIDTDSDGAYGLTICYGASLTDTIYVNRSPLAVAIRVWATAVVGDSNEGGATYAYGWKSNGHCNNDGSNIRVFWRDLGTCSYLGGVAGETQPLGGGYNEITIWLNINCASLFDWDDPVDANKISAQAVLVHEVGHAFGIDHFARGSDHMMSDGGPDNCNGFWGTYPSLSAFDANALRERYGGITPTYNMFPASSICYD